MKVTIDGLRLGKEPKEVIVEESGEFTNAVRVQVGFPDGNHYYIDLTSDEARLVAQALTLYAEAVAQAYRPGELG